MKLNMERSLYSHLISREREHRRGTKGILSTLAYISKTLFIIMMLLQKKLERHSVFNFAFGVRIPVSMHSSAKPAVQGLTLVV